jgi:hypothetical protein
VIQNADDVGARTVRFALSPRAPRELLVVHDGTRVTAPHVLAMTLALVSTKGDDAAATGKFGIGLKTLTRLVTLAGTSITGTAARTSRLRASMRTVRWAKPSGLRATSCHCARPNSPSVRCSTDPDRLVLETCTEYNSATPTAIPTNANSSCTRRARNRRR